MQPLQLSGQAYGVGSDGHLGAVCSHRLRTCLTVELETEKPRLQATHPSRVHGSAFLGLVLGLHAEPVAGRAPQEGGCSCEMRLPLHGIKPLAAMWTPWRSCVMSLRYAA